MMKIIVGTAKRWIYAINNKSTHSEEDADYTTNTWLQTTNDNLRISIAKEVVLILLRGWE